MYLPSKDHNYPLQGEPEALGGSRNPQSYKNNCFKTAATALEAAVTKDSYCHDNCCECGDTCFCTKTAADPTMVAPSKHKKQLAAQWAALKNRVMATDDFVFVTFAEWATSLILSIIILIKAKMEARLLTKIR
jgi:hypothetical protein